MNHKFITTNYIFWCVRMQIYAGKFIYHLRRLLLSGRKAVCTVEALCVAAFRAFGQASLQSSSAMHQRSKFHSDGDRSEHRQINLSWGPRTARDHSLSPSSQSMHNVDCALFSIRQFQHGRVPKISSWKVGVQALSPLIISELNRKKLVEFLCNFFYNAFVTMLTFF